MLLDYYYSVKSQLTTESVTLFDVILLPACSVYEGHFPGMPVTPGVCNIQMIKECVERIIGRQLLLEYIVQCKFTALISPLQHQKLQVRIEIKKPSPAPPKGERMEAIATIGQGEKEFMVFKGEFVML